jgi:hypothetical protein
VRKNGRRHGPPRFAAPDFVQPVARRHAAPIAKDRARAKRLRVDLRLVVQPQQRRAGNVGGVACAGRAIVLRDMRAPARVSAARATPSSDAPQSAPGNKKSNAPMRVRKW